MKRRDFISFAGCAAVWPIAAQAQQPPLPVIGFLGSASPTAWTSRLRAFREGLSASGYAEERNVKIEYLWAEGRHDRLPALAADLVRRRVALIVVLGSVSSVLAAKAATSTIPIVFRLAVDPVEIGLVSSLNQPGSNLTGVTTLGVEVGPKQLEFLREVVPAATVIVLLVNPTNPILLEIQTKNLAAAAHALGLKLEVLNASTDHDLNTVFATLVEQRVDGLVIGADAFFNSRHELLAALAMRHAVPTISPYREFAEAGGLMSYGGSMTDACHQAGIYAGSILKGVKPASLPVQQASKVDLIINLKTANALRLTVPPTLLRRADEMLE